MESKTLHLHYGSYAFNEKKILAEEKGWRAFTWTERTAAIVMISSEQPSSLEAKIIFDIIGS